MQEKLIDKEKVIERLLVIEVKKRGGLCLKLVTTFFSGLPDRLILLPNKTIYFVELKTTGLKARKLQINVHKVIQNLGFDVYVIDTIQKVKELFHD